MKQTTLDINGPVLSFTTNPVGVASTGIGIGSTGGGTATFIGIATAAGSGEISYQWYEIDVGPLSNSTYLTGTATTTLTITNLITPTDNKRQFYLTADYIASAYQSSTPVTAGTARSTGNAVNDPLSSTVGILTVYPLIEVIAQPTDGQAILNTNKTFNIDASLTDAYFGPDVSYQWQLNGQNVDEGVIVSSTTTSTTVATPQEFNYSSNTTVTIPASATDIEITIAAAAGGGGGSDAGGSGGGGGAGRVGKFTYSSGTSRSLSFVIGGSGNGGSSGGQSAGGNGGSSNVASGGNGGGAGQNGWSGGGGGGGGATAIYDNTIGGYTIVSGAGGGGGGGSNNRGAPSGETANSFSSSSGSFSISGGNGGETKNGDGGGGGGGGGGATGGGGGGAGQDNDFGGGGGSGGGSKYRTDLSTLQSQWTNSGNGYVNLKYTAVSTTATTITRNTTVSGAKTSTLTIKSDTVGIQTIRSIVSNVNATNSPIISNVVNFTTISDTQQFNINVETITNTIATISSINLFNGDYQFVVTSTDIEENLSTSLYSFYAPDKDINVEMDLYGGKGTDKGSYTGGEGGFSRIRFTMLRNTEYVIAGLINSINTPFIYRKANLIAAIGGGGNAGISGRGGFGGGVNISGQSGFGRDNGFGGAIITAGNLPADGIFGSATNLSAIFPDTKEVFQSGGRVLSCSRGVYWRQQGLSACSDISGTTKFRLSNGTILTNTGSITRGFKAGYAINETAGAGTANGGRGGNGATGGNGGVNGGGGGGNGYTDGSVTVVSTQQGGSTGTAKVILRVVL